MPEYATNERVDHLTARVDVLEREVEGEKIVTRYILEQTRRNGDDLAALRTRMDRVEQKVDGLDRKVDSLDRKLDSLGRKVDGLSGLDRKVDGLMKSLPSIVGEAVRDAFRERDRS